MRVLLVNPPMPYETKGHLQTPLGLCYLSSIVSPIAETIVYDCNVSNNLQQVVSHFQPDIVGVSVLTATYKNSIGLLNTLSPQLKHACLLVAGGVHASILPQDLLNNGFDLVIRGEGERTFYNVVSAMINSREYLHEPGLSYIDDTGTITHNSDVGLIDQLDEIPFPDRKDLPLHRYEHESILTSRGCPFSCFYCSSSCFWGHTVRYRSAENVFSELLQLYRSGRTKFYFCDDNFASSHARVKELCERIISHDVQIEWCASTRVDTVELSLLKLMKQAGCKILSFGIETGLDAFQRNIKLTTVEAAIGAFEIVREVGIRTRTTWIVGLGRTFEDEQRSLELIKELLPDQVSVHCLIPFPNTDAWNYPEKYNLIIDKQNIDWDVMNTTFSPYVLDYVRFRHISKEQIMSLLEATRKDLLSYGYDGKVRTFGTFLDRDIIKILQ